MSLDLGAVATTGSSLVSIQPRPTDLGITLLHTPGHTPDSLAWYDHAEMHLYVGDTLYEEGVDGMAIQWPGEGNMIEWAFSMQKLLFFVRGEHDRARQVAERNAKNLEDTAPGWTQVACRVKLGAGHQTHSADAEEFVLKVGRFWWEAMQGRIPVIRKEYKRGDAYYTWRDKDGKAGLSLQAPARLMDDAKAFFVGSHCPF